MSKDRSQHEVSLLPDELCGIAEQLSPSVQVVNKPCLFPGGVRIPQWAGLIVIDGEVEGSIHTPCPIESYAVASDVLASILAEQPDHIPDAKQMVEPSLFAEATP